MSERKRTRNLLEELSQGQPVPGEPGEALRQDQVRGKGKATFYMTTHLIDRLDDAWMEHKKHCRSTGVKPFSKSQIVEKALTQFLDTFQQEE